jgi:hypothetical protein
MVRVRVRVRVRIRVIGNYIILRVRVMVRK